MSAGIDLVALGPGPEPEWPLGEVVPVAVATPQALATAVQAHLATHRPAALLHWDLRLGPPPRVCADLLAGPDDVWHAGLALGTGGQPASIDLVAPTWMFNADPPVDLPATSWRLCLLACLVRSEVVRRLGYLDPAFLSLTAAGLDAGHRWISRGALCRHEPGLVAGAVQRPVLDPIGAEDQQRFVQRRFGSRWATYATLRSRHRLHGLRRLRHLGAEPTPEAGLLSPPSPAPIETASAPVSVVIPTIDRYPWLATVLDHLAGQTVRPLEVLVIDQTPLHRRQDLTTARAGDLPLRVIQSEVAGQCTARNLALRQASGELILFLDDDDELPPDLLARHLARLAQTGADANCGVAVEPGEDARDPAFLRFRQSDVFPTNNTLLRKGALADSGLFDLAFDRGERADHDLGMRLYLTGHRLVLDPETEVLHHHAPRGGLRSHGARVVTYRASRQSTTTRHGLAATEVYLWRRYYRPHQVREAMRLRILGTFSRRGTPLERVLRVLVQLVFLRDTRRQVREADAAAAVLAEQHPTIPALADAEESAP